MNTGKQSQPGRGDSQAARHQAGPQVYQVAPGSRVVSRSPIAFTRAPSLFVKFVATKSDGTHDLKTDGLHPLPTGVRHAGLLYDRPDTVVCSLTILPPAVNARYCRLYPLYRRYSSGCVHDA
ncbi:hypothetical protein RhiJN_12381 [Ceratobasidium sp. AG-Ba]|nr:hypothetical protein RhiJN_12381 [Ceratobasidium sp. AG-Ba]